MKKRSWMRHREAASPLTWVLVGSAAIVGLVVLVRSVPDLVRYVRVERM